MGPRVRGDDDRPGVVNYPVSAADHLAHVLHAGGAGLGDRGRYRRLHLVLRHLLGQVGRDDRDLLALLRGEFGAAALVVEFDRFLALLDHFLKHAKQIGVRQRRLALAARGDVGVLDGRIDHAQRGELALVLGLHGLLDRVVDVVAQHGCLTSSLVYRKIPRLYRGCARHATGITGRSAGGPGMGHRPRDWSSRTARFGSIWPKTADAAKPAVKYAANACESPSSGFDGRGRLRL
jgi:hypothetical protein